MKHILLLFTIPIFAVFCKGNTSGSREVQIRNISISENTKKLPDTFPHFLVPPGADVVMAGIHDSETALALPEGAARMETASTSQKTAEFYYDVFRRNGWNVIQSIDEPEKKMIMAESRFGRLLTVLLYGNEKTSIKIYIKQLGGN